MSQKQVISPHPHANEPDCDPNNILLRGLSKGQVPPQSPLLWLSRLLGTPLQWLWALCHSHSPSVKTSHVTALGSGDCIFARRGCALWSFSARENSRFILSPALLFSGVLLHASSMPRMAFWSREGHRLLHLASRRCWVSKCPLY